MKLSGHWISFDQPRGSTDSRSFKTFSFLSGVSNRDLSNPSGFKISYYSETCLEALSQKTACLEGPQSWQKVADTDPMQLSVSVFQDRFSVNH